MPEREIAVKVQDLTKSFKIPLEASSGIKQKLINTLKGRKGYRDFTPLNDISFEIEKGDFFGIVGRNGSGKSTLLKTIAGIYTPNKGAVHVNGTLVPFIELGVGFNPELSGRENVFLNGALLGFSHAEMEAMYDDIVEFAELGEFMDERLKNYSSGMQVRLAFSIAIKAEGDVLLLDEVLAVGDEAFQRKCYEYFESLKRKKKTVILVTHDMSAVEKFCTKALLIDQGKIIKQGSPKLVASTYSDILNPNSKEAIIDQVEESKKDRIGDFRYQFGDVRLSVSDVNLYGSTIKLASTVTCKLENQGDLMVSYAIKTNAGQVLCGDKYLLSEKEKPAVGESKKLTFSFPNIFGQGKYLIDLSILSKKDNTYNDLWLDCAAFTVQTEKSNGFNVMIKSDIAID